MYVCLPVLLFFQSSPSSAQTITADTLTAGRWFKTADSLMDEGRHDSAIYFFNKASQLYEKHQFWQLQLKNLNKVAECYWRNGLFDQSMVKARQVLYKSIDKLGPGNIEEAGAYENLGVINDETGNFKAAYQYYMKALDIQMKLVGEYHPNVANTYNNLAILFDKTSEDQKALEYYKKSLVIYYKLYGKESMAAANALNNIGTMYYKAGDFRQALLYFRQSLDMKKKLPGDKRLIISDSYENVGLVYKDEGDFKEALHYYEKGLSIKQEILGEKHYNVAKTLANVGALYYLLGNYDKGLEYYEKALRVNNAAFGERSGGVAGNYKTIGNVYVEQGYNDLGLEYYQRAISINREVYGEKSPNVASVYSNMGVAWLHKGDHDRALDCFRRAMDIQVVNPGRKHPDIAFTYNNLGEAFLAKGDPAQALKYFREALAVNKEIFGDTNFHVGSTYANIANVYRRMNDYNKGLEYSRQSLTVLHKAYGVRHPLIARVYNDLGNAWLEKEKFTEALTACQQAIIANVVGFSDVSVNNNPALRDYLNGFYLLKSLSLKGKIFEQFYRHSRNPQHLQQALAAFQLCDSLIDIIREEQVKSEDKISLGTASADMYKQVIRVCLELQQLTGNEAYLHKAFYFSEKSKSGVLLQAVADLSARQSGGIPSSLLLLEKELKLDKAFYQSRILHEKSGAGLDAAALKAYEQKLFNTNRRYDSLIAAFEKRFPQYYRLKYKNEISTVDGIRQRLRGTTTALLEYFIADSTVYVFVITKDQFTVVPVPTDGNLTALLQTFRKRINPGNLSGDPQQLFGSFTTAAQQLYRQLFAAVQNRLAGVDKLVIIPHGAMSFVPFGILVRDQGNITPGDFRSLPYLLKDFDISYAYSATLWNREPETLYRNNWKHQFAGFAPSYQTNLLAQSRELNNYGTFRDKITNLAFTKTEISHATTYFPGVIFTGSQATEAAFKKQSGKDRILHLAMHAVVDEQNPLQSKLLFSNQGDTLEDGFLNAYELYNMELNAELAVLSACNTGYGGLAGGEGVMSLSRAFAYAGCQSLVMSLWEANDKATAEIMRLFYQNLAAGKSKDAALRMAKLAYLQQADPLTAHPYFWGAFIANGNMQPLKQETFIEQNKWWLMAGGVLLLLLCYAGYKRKVNATA